MGTRALTVLRTKQNEVVPTSNTYSIYDSRLKNVLSGLCFDFPHRIVAVGVATFVAEAGGFGPGPAPAQ